MRVTEWDVERLLKWRERVGDPNEPDEKLLRYALEHLRRLRRAFLHFKGEVEDIHREDLDWESQAHALMDEMDEFLQQEV